MGLFTPKKTKLEFQNLSIEELKLAPYQRMLKRKRIEQYAREFDPDIFGIILVSYRDDQYWIVDGQHRVEVAKLVGKSTVTCQVIYGLTYEQEAEKFHKINDRKVRLNANHKFHAKVESKDEAALDVISILRKHGFGYSKEGGTALNDTIICVGSLQKIYKTRGYDALDEVIGIVKGAWLGEKESLRGYMIKGVNTFVSNYDYDRKTLIKALSRFEAKEIQRRALSYMEGSPRLDNGSCPAIAKVIRDIYDDEVMNKKLSVKPCKLKIA